MLTGQWQHDYGTSDLTLRLSLTRKQRRLIPTTVWTIIEPDWSQPIKDNFLFIYS